MTSECVLTQFIILQRLIPVHSTGAFRSKRCIWPQRECYAACCGKPTKHL